MQKLKHSCLLIFAFLLFYTPISAQESKVYDGEHAEFYRGEDLYSKDQYSAALKVFSEYLEGRYFHNQFTLKARYYEAMCVLRLYQNNTEKYVLQFIKDYPESIYTTELYLELAQYYYQKRKFEDAIKYYEKVSPYQVAPENFAEYHFKKGYAYFNTDQKSKAKESFYTIKDSSDSQYGAPATYYYGHIAYDEQKYQAALESFLSLQDHATFGKVVPYYITQIYYLQGNYEGLIEMAPNLKEGNNKQREAEMARLIGDAYYRVEKYDEAIPYLQKYQAVGSPGRSDNYQLGYAYFRINDYEKATQYLSYVTQPEDSLAQIAMYQLGQSYEALNQPEYAKNAYEKASSMPYDATIEEDALYRFALIAYQLDFNPYQDAIKAFTRYLEQYPNSDRKKEVYQYLINVYTTTKNYRAALESMNEMSQMDYPMQQAFQLVAYNHGVEMFQSNRYQDAIDIFAMVKRYPIDRSLNAKSIYWTAAAYHKMDDLNTAIRFYRDFMKEPGSYSMDLHTDANYQIGYAYFEMEQYTNAIQAFRTYIQSEKDNKEMIKEAYLRTADCYFLQENDEQAIIYYEKARQIPVGEKDYAIFQSARAKGYAERFQDKISDLSDIVNNYAQSIYRVRSIYEIAETYLKDLGERKKALNYYNTLLVDYPQNLLVQPSLFEVGGIYMQESQLDQAEDIFLRILNDYDDQATQKQALNRLKDVYVLMGEPDKFYDLADQYSFSNVTTSSKDSISYSVAYRAYIDSNCNEAIKGFTKYIDQFSNPIFEAESHYYRASCYWAKGEKDKAHEDYKAILKLSNNEFTENSLLRASKGEYDKENYEEALQYYRRLENAATFESNILVAKIGQMRCYYYLENWEYAYNYADQVLNAAEIPENVELEGYYVRGVANYKLNKYEEALPDLKTTSALNSGVLGAETQFYRAEILHLQGQYDEAETQIKKLIKERSSFQYWVGRGFVLLGKNLIEQDNYFQARHTLESVLANYKKEDDGVKDEAREVLQYLDELENADSGDGEKSSEETVIEINEEEEGNDE